MTYSDDLRSKILNCIKSKKYTMKEIKETFKISNDTYYKIKNNSSNKLIKKSNSKFIKVRKTKISNEIKKYVINYVTKRINFNYKKLINLVFNKFETKISKTTIYDILKKNILRKRKFIKKVHLIIIFFKKVK